MKFFAIIALLFLPFTASASVVINEIAWMGSEVAGVDPGQWWRYEWLELYNSSSNPVSLDGWVIELRRSDLDFSIRPMGTIGAGVYFLIAASDKIFNYDFNYSNLAGKFNNSGQDIILKDAAGIEIDRVDASSGWQAGDNTTKETMQKSGSGWTTAIATPRAQNVGLPANQVGQSSGQNQTNTAPAAGTSSYAPTPTVLVNAGPDRTIFVNEEIILSGTVTILQGAESEIRFLWDFGNGSMQEGQEVRYAYTYPGTYTAAFIATLGTYAHTDYVKVTVLPQKQVASATVEKEITKDEIAAKPNMPQPQVAQVVQPTIQKNEEAVSGDESQEAPNIKQGENDENKITVKDSAISLRDIFAFSRWLALAGLVGLAAAAALVFLRN